MTLLERVANRHKSGGFSGVVKGCVEFLKNDLLREGYVLFRYKISNEVTLLSVNETEAKFFITTPSEFVRFNKLSGEEQVLEDFLAELQSSDVFLDVGANVGMYACFAGQKLSDGAVAAFEPHPENFDSLVNNIKMNDIGASLFQCGLSDEHNEVKLCEASPESGEGKHSIATEKGSGDIIIEVKTIDQLVAAGEITSPSVVKIDVEGAELNVLRGGQTALTSENCRLLYCEVHPEKLGSFGGSYSEVINTIEKMGFQTTVIEGKYGGYSTTKGVK